MSMLNDIPVINWFEEPIKKSIQSIFNDTNDYVESLDLINIDEFISRY